jgi:hypothetical protein
MKIATKARSKCMKESKYQDPEGVTRLIVSNRVILFLNRIHKKIPSGLNPIYSRFLCGNFLLVSFPPMFDMGESLKECEGDIFPLEKIVNGEITF